KAPSAWCAPASAGARATAARSAASWGSDTGAGVAVTTGVACRTRQTRPPLRETASSAKQAISSRRGAFVAAGLLRQSRRPGDPFVGASPGARRRSVLVSGFGCRCCLDNGLSNPPRSHVRRRDEDCLRFFALQAVRRIRDRFQRTTLRD